MNTGWRHPAEPLFNFASRWARKRLSAEVWARIQPDRHWFTQEFLNGLDAEDDKDAVFKLWLFLGGPEGSISDST